MPCDRSGPESGFPPGRHGLQPRHGKVLGDRDQTDCARPYRKPATSAAGDLVGSLAGSGTPEIKSQAEGIFQNVTDPSELNDQRVNVVALAEATAGLWCGGGLPDRRRLFTSPQIG